MKMGWLPSVEPDEDPWGEARPVRPNLPLLRWFSYTKLHALQLGALLGVFVYAAHLLGETGVALGTVTLVLKYVLDHRKVEDSSEACDHKVGFHDVIKKPHYFGTSLVTSVACCWVLFEYLAVV